MIYDYKLGILFSFFYSTFAILSTFGKNKKEIIKVQLIDQIFGALSNFFLCSYSAVVTNIVNVVRNYFVCKNKTNKAIIVVFVGFYIIFGTLFNTKGLIGIFPIIASSSYAIVCFKTQNAQILRVTLICNQVLLFVHDACIKAYPSMIVEVLMIFMTMYNIIEFEKNKKMKLNENYTI